MIYIVNGKEVDIPTDKPYGKGSEGIVYKKGNYAYKIYHKETSVDDKEACHKRLTGIKTKQIILPDGLIYTTNGKYVGYRAPLIPGAKRKSIGLSKLPKNTLVKNLQVLEEDFNVLSKEHVLAVDVTPINYILNKKDNTMNIIDPGNYRHHCLTNGSYQRQNKDQLDNLVELLIYLDFLEYKPYSTKRKIQRLKELIKRLKQKKNCTYYELFRDEIKENETLDDYAKSLKKYII